MKKIFISATCILILFLSGCSRNVMSNLDKAESYMEEQPEQALFLLEHIDRDMLTTRKARAENIRRHIDKAYIGRLLLLKESIYGILLEYDKAISTALEAAKFSIDGNKPGNYHQAILNVARYNLMKNNISETDKYLNIIKGQWDNLTLRRKHTYYDIKMLSYIDTYPDSSLVYLTEYLNLDGTEDIFNWRTISHVYEKMDYTIKHCKH